MKQMSENLDNRLQSDSQLHVAKIVASMPDEPVSMVWRSNLNETLRANAVTAKRKKFVFNFLSPVAGLGIACTLAIVVMVRPPAAHPRTPIVGQPPVVSNSLEAGLVRLHQDDVRTSDVAGTGLNPTEAINDANNSDSSDSSYDSGDDFEF